MMMMMMSDLNSRLGLADIKAETLTSEVTHLDPVYSVEGEN